MDGVVRALQAGGEQWPGRQPLLQSLQLGGATLGRRRGLEGAAGGRQQVGGGAGLEVEVSHENLVCFFDVCCLVLCLLLSLMCVYEFVVVYLLLLPRFVLGCLFEVSREDRGGARRKLLQLRHQQVGVDVHHADLGVS